MATGLSGTAEISGYFNPLLEATMTVARESVVMPTLVTQYSAMGWEDRKLSIYPQIAAQTIGETEDVNAPTKFDKSAVQTLTPIEIAAQVILTDRRIETDPDGARADAATELGGALTDKIELDLVTLFSSFSKTTGAGAGTTFTLASVAKGMAYLRQQKVRGPFYVVLHPYHWLDVWTEIGKPTTSVVASDFANKAMADYFVANLINAEWYQHALIPFTTTDAHSAVFNREALAFDMRRAPNVEPERDASKRAWELTITAGYADGVRRNDHGVDLLADATAP